MMPSSKKLIVEYEFDFYLIGIVSPVREYKLAWLINKMLGIHLVKKPDLEINFINNKLIISNFKSGMEPRMYRLLKNQSVGEPAGKPYYLLPELKNFDFLLMISDESNTVVMDDLLENIRQIPEVYYVMQTDLSQLDSKENLIF